MAEEEEEKEEKEEDSFGVWPQISNSSSDSMQHLMITHVFGGESGSTDVEKRSVRFHRNCFRL